jgi:uncharacterized membrane protein
VDPVQVITLIVVILSLIGTVIYNSQKKNDWLFLPVYLVYIHTIIFYVCVIFFPGDDFSFTHWSRWLRLQEYGTLACILIALVVRHHKIIQRFVGTKKL